MDGFGMRSARNWNVQNEEYKPSNREQAMKAKYGWFWCAKCDRQLVSQIMKCPVCGARENRKKRKMP